MAMTSGPSKGVKAEINITPLVDVVLVLLIIFMVVTPMLQRGKDVHLPQSRKIDEENKESDPIILSLTKDKKMFFESTQVNDAELEEKIKAQLVGAPGKKLLLKGDERLTFGDIRKMMNLTRKAGAKSVSLGVQELKK